MIGPMTQAPLGQDVDLGSLRATVVGDGATTIYLHGGLLDRSMFEPQFDAFPGRRGVALDLPGFGDSPRLPGPMTVTAMAACVVEALDGFEAPWDLVGLSLGAGVAVEVARLRPVAVRSLCLISAGRAVKRTHQDIQVMKDRLASGGRAAMAQGFAERMLAPDADDHLVARVQAMALAPSDETVCALYDLLGDYPAVLEMAVALYTPILIIVGERDASVDRDRVRDLRSQSPRRDVLIAEGCGHLPNLERPQMINAALAAFWASIEREP